MRVIALNLFTLLALSTIFSAGVMANSTAGIVIEDARGEQYFSALPQRVVVLNWDLLEQVLVLGETPLAAPELNSYRQWVVKPSAPDSIEEIGSRAEPNLEKIASLKPDVILAATPQEDLLDVLESIAPVVYLPNFELEYDSAQRAMDNLKVIGQLLGKNEQAEQIIDEIEAEFSRLRTQLATRYAENTDLVVMRFSTLNSVFFYSENSTTQYVVRKLGFNNPIKVAPQAWGVKQQRINPLQHIEQGYVMYFRPFPDEPNLASSRLWQAMPFVQEHRFNGIEPVWNYGGAYSLIYMAQAITDSLMEIE
ncbi:iron-siderophore ABC transporter substrate-binding protein [Vibrio sp. WXL210]|uniref:iron-siderophore ABC transporter substrate-binding protein n=1 Tax=Vibrio sp. WXL210 TaxID=3450709 RepID=UPI003EC9441F